MVVLDLVWITEPNNLSTIRNGEELLDLGENMNVQQSAAQKFD